MRTRTLGRNGPVVSEIGLGCWQFGGDFGAMGDETAMAIMAAAVGTGVSFFDTADVYGSGRSERLIGRFLRQRPGRIQVATKYGRGNGAFPDGYSETGLREAIAASAGRLGVTCIDLLQLHCIPTARLRDGAVFDWLRRAQADGLIRHFGASVETVEEGLLCLGQPNLQSLQIIFNIFRQKPAAELLPRAAEAGVGIIVRLPLASGLLSGRYTADTVFAPEDHRTFNRDGQCFNVGETFAGLPFERGVALADQVRAVVPAGMAMSDLSLRWILDHEAVSTIIPGASSPAQALANAAVSGHPALDPAVHARLAALYRDHIHACIRGPY